MRVVDEIVSHFITDSFLDPKDDRVLETILNQPIPGTPLKMRDLTDPQTLRDKLLQAQAQLSQQEPEEFVAQCRAAVDKLLLSPARHQSTSKNSIRYTGDKQ